MSSAQARLIAVHRRSAGRIATGYLPENHIYFICSSSHTCDSAASGPARRSWGAGRPCAVTERWGRTMSRCLFHVRPPCPAVGTAPTFAVGADLRIGYHRTPTTSPQTATSALNAFRRTGNRSTREYPLSPADRPARRAMRNGQPGPWTPGPRDPRRIARTLKAVVTRDQLPVMQAVP